MLARTLSILVVGALALGCQNRDLAIGARSQIAAEAPVVAAAAPVAPRPAVAAQPARPMFEPGTAVPSAAGGGEQTLDTAPAPVAAPAPTVLGAPLLETKNRRSKVRTPSDEHLPRWVPVKGRLTVVDASDLAENLGLVPKGATKKTEDRISVADKLAEEAAARPSDPMTRGSSWNFSVKGPVRTRR